MSFPSFSQITFRLDTLSTTTTTTTTTTTLIKTRQSQLYSDFLWRFFFSQALDLSLLLRESTRNFDSMHRRELVLREGKLMELKGTAAENQWLENQWLEDLQHDECDFQQFGA